LALDFREPGHLPNRRAPDDHADPYELPRQRRGTTPQMHGRYPDYDVLAEVDHWDEVTRKVVLARLDPRPALRFFTHEEAVPLAAFCDVVTDQHEEPRIPVLSFVDEKLAEGKGDGYRYFDLPDDGEVWRRVARGLDESTRAEWRAPSFAAAPLDVRLDVVRVFSQGNLRGEAWRGLNVSRAWKVVMRDVLQSFYSHPWAWNEIGFGGPAYPRGYAAFGSAHLRDKEDWEGVEAVHSDPVKETGG
jgi:hypothetical protein